MPAVVSRAIGECAVEQLSLRALGARDVRMRVEAGGICHSDISLCDGSLGGELPVVLGHEGVGRIVETGADVGTLRVGDRVVLAAVAPCGLCWSCTRSEPHLCTEVRRQARPAFLDRGDRTIRGASGLGTLTDEIVVDERVAVRVRSDLPAEQLAVVGCAVLTGGGSVLNIAATRPGDAVLVIGAGGVGLAAVQAAAAVGAELVVAVDTSSAARDAAAACGATHVADPVDPTMSDALIELTGGRGFDSTMECVASARTFELAWHLTRRGGHIVVIGVPPADVAVPVPLAQVPLSGRRISGCVYGASVVHRDIPMYVAMAEAGRIDLSLLVGRTISLSGAPAVLLGGGLGPGRTVVVNG